MLNKKNDKFLEERKQAFFLKIRPIIANQLKVDQARITPESRIGEDLRVDSLDALEIVMALEEEFNLEILDEDSEKMKTIYDITAYLAERIKE